MSLSLDDIIEVSESYGVQEVIDEFAKRGLINVDDADVDELFQRLLYEHLEELEAFIRSIVETIPTLLN